MAGSASFNSASTMREPVGGRHPCTGNCLPIGRGGERSRQVAQGSSRMQRRGWCSGPGSPVSNRLAHHRLRSCNAGRFSTFRLPATLRRRLRVRLQRAIEQPELAAAPKGSEPGPSPTATAAIVITQGGRLSIRVVPRCTDPDEASHALLNAATTPLVQSNRALLGQLARVSKYDLRLPVVIADLPCRTDALAAE